MLVPLCGKSEDLDWLATQHEDVTGVELSDIAVRGFFVERFYTPTVTQLSGSHSLYQFDEVSIYQGDFFTAPLDKYDAVYDRAALIALAPEQRAHYVDRVLTLLNENGKLFLISLEHDRDSGRPPFSVDENLISELFSNCLVELIDDIQVDNGREKVWIIKR